jgi:hypothetical protein
VATDLTGDPYLGALADLYGAAERAAWATVSVTQGIHKQRRRAAGHAAEAIGVAKRLAWEAIETHLREYPQPVQFVHDGWRWTIPSAGRGMICVPINTREEVTA